MKSNCSPEEIALRIRRAGVIRIVTHRRPDGDAIGSAFGLAMAIEAVFPEKEVFVFCADPIPPRLRFLVPGRDFLTGEALLTACLPRPDLVISVDIASRKLFGDLEDALADEVDIKLDHHKNGDDFAPGALVNAEASATGELIFRLIPFLGEVRNEPLMRSAYRALYGAISSDTGGFRYSNVTPQTLRIAADLLQAGVDGAEIAHGLFESKGHDEIRAIRAAYEKMTFHAGGKIALTVITVSDMNRYDIDEDVLGVISSLPREIAGVSLGIVLRQSKKYPDTYKISMRSDESVDVSELCTAFGGGGHMRAAGGELRAASEQEAIRLVLAAAESAVAGA